VGTLQYYGAFARLSVNCPQATIVVDLDPRTVAGCTEPGTTVHLHWHDDAVHGLAV
jgi:hypothetical protein